MVTLGGLGLITAWGPGLESLPDDAVAAAAGRDVLTLPTPVRPGDRYRRSTRESLLALAAVDALLGATSLSRDALAGGRTALLYATAAAYAASNRAFVESAPGSVYFPYTAPSAVPAEVAIELGLRGAYLTFLGGAAATHEALRHAGRLLRDGECDRALVLAVETFADCGDLFRRGRWLIRKPLVEAAACVLLRLGGGTDAAAAGDVCVADQTILRLGSPSAAPRTATRRCGNTLACGPLIALGLAAAAVPGA